MTDELERQTDQAEILAKQCYPLFAGKDSTIQGAALAELVARHLAGHVILGDKAETRALRAHLLEAFVTTVKDLIPIIDEDVIQPEIARRAQ